MGPLFTPPVVSNINGPLGTLMVPSQDGGTNWQGGSFDPETGILYVASGTTVVSKAVVPPYPGQSEMAYIEGNAVTGPRTTGGSGSAAGGGRSEFQPAAAPRADARRSVARAAEARARRAGLAAAEAAVRPHQRDRHEARRDALANRARRDARTTSRTIRC